jgi:serine/threonine-protein kinase HipA
MTALPRSLTVLMGGVTVGQVLRDGARLSFEYDDQWRRRGAFPLSLSMPLPVRRHSHATISNWMWNLLPDNQVTLREIGARHDVSANNPFALLSRIGLDCQGAVQFVAPDEPPLQPGVIEWLTISDVAARLASLRAGSPQGREVTEGQFSLSGAQPKTALCLLDGRWGVPSGRLATTHILKPPSRNLSGQAQNEHFCLNLARRAGLPAAASFVQAFDDEVAIVVERYDRIVSGPQTVMRVHQEDLCQALGLHPELKYESDGGPGIAAIMKLLEQSSAPEDDRRSFIRAIAFNFLILGTDAHAKNYSLLLGTGQVRLAPLYDVASFLPYLAGDGQPLDRLRMPMRFGDRRHYAQLEPRHVERLSQALRFPIAEALDIFRDLATHLPGWAETLRDEFRGGPADHPVLDDLLRALDGWCRNVTRRWWTDQKELFDS